MQQLTLGDETLALSLWDGEGEPAEFTAALGYTAPEEEEITEDEEENTLTFWHCGTAACTLARKDTGAVVGVHPNRKIGPALKRCGR